MEEDGAGAHDTRLQSGKERHLSRSRQKRIGDALKRLHFSVASQLKRWSPNAVPAARDDLAVQGDDRADGEVTVLFGLLGEQDGSAKERKRFCVQGSALWTMEQWLMPTASRRQLDPYRDLRSAGQLMASIARNPTPGPPGSGEDPRGCWALQRLEPRRKPVTPRRRIIHSRIPKRTDGCERMSGRR